jgi:hypothetical protein
MRPNACGQAAATGSWRSNALLAADLAAGFGEVPMPEALVRKYPRAPYELR